MPRPLVSLIAAVARDGGIGHRGGLLVHLPDDLPRFKRITLGASIVMGRKTWQSIGRALPGRRNIVVSRDPDFRATAPRRRRRSTRRSRSPATPVASTSSVAPPSTPQRCRWRTSFSSRRSMRSTRPTRSSRLGPQPVRVSRFKRAARNARRLALHLRDLPQSSGSSRPRPSDATPLVHAHRGQPPAPASPRSQARERA